MIFFDLKKSIITENMEVKDIPNPFRTEGYLFIIQV
jgi:hypothetical protein